MQFKKYKIICLIVLLSVAVYAIPLALAAQTGEKQEIVWQITNARVIDPGQTTSSDEGILTTGYTIEAKAKTTSKSMLQDGNFQMVVTVFSPKTDMPGQKAGHWYLNGQWTITDAKATSSEKKARHSKSKIKGTLTADLLFNPAVKTGDIEAKVRTPMSPATGRWSQGKGTFSGNALFEGSLVLNAVFRPEMKGGRS
jgi:hypothetical protein